MRTRKSVTKIKEVCRSIAKDTGQKLVLVNNSKQRGVKKDATHNTGESHGGGRES